MFTSVSRAARKRVELSLVELLSVFYGSKPSPLVGHLCDLDSRTGTYRKTVPSVSG